MPRVRRYKLASRLATMALGGAALAIATGPLPALAYCMPPSSVPPPPGGYRNVVTSQTCGLRGCVIEAMIDGLRVAVTGPAGDFAKMAQVTLLAPSVPGIGDAAHPSYRSVAGVGILVQLNGRADTGTFARPITVRLAGRQTRPGDRVAVWDGATFRFIGDSVTGHSVAFSYDSGLEQDFAVLAPARGRGGGGHRPGRAHRPGPGIRLSRAGSLGDLVLESVFFARPGAPPAGAGVRPAGWLAARGH